MIKSLWVKILIKGEIMGKISLEVNGRKVEKEASDNTLLSTFLREHLQLTGTHIGCDTSQCGACVVHVDGNSLKSCTASVSYTHLTLPTKA